MNIGEKIKILRKQTGLSQDELAEKIKIDGRQISRYENNKMVPSTEVIVKLAKLFNVSLDYLILEDAPQTSIKYTNNIELIELLQSIETLPQEDVNSLKNIIDAVATRKKVKQLANPS